MTPSMDQPTTLLICCGSLAKEIIALTRENDWSHMQVTCLPASVHNTPDKIPEGVRAKIHEARGKFDQILVMFSDCGTGGLLDRVLEEEGVERIGGSHCYEVLLGTENYAAMMQAEPGRFFLTDFLVRNFDNLIIRGLGLDRFPKLTPRYFGKYKYLVYLAQVDDAGLRDKAAAAAERLGLELEVRQTGPGDYQQFLETRLGTTAEPAKANT